MIFHKIANKNNKMGDILTLNYFIAVGYKLEKICNNYCCPFF